MFVPPGASVPPWMVQPQSMPASMIPMDSMSRVNRAPLSMMPYPLPNSTDDFLPHGSYVDMGSGTMGITMPYSHGGYRVGGLPPGIGSAYGNLTSSSGVSATQDPNVSPSDLT